MWSASSSSSAPSFRRLGAFGALALTLAVVTVGASASRHANAVAAEAPVHSYRGHTVLTSAASKRLHAFAWEGGTYVSATGESVRVLVSTTLPDAHTVGQQWADHFASLLHGSELALVTAYVVTQEEMRELCGPRALGCYGSDELAFIGGTVGGVTAQEVATHEYGHHVAANRANPPWLAVAWGPKRWASAANICARAEQGAVYPGDEGEHYELNPGEGFAEVYRVLSELRAGATSFSWQLVDSSFSPDAAALQAAERDVTEPWATPVVGSFRGRFTAGGKRSWKTTVATPLDGTFALTLTFPRGSFHEIELLDSGGRLLARGLWSGTAAKKLTTTICGQRNVVIRITRGGPASRFALRVTHD